jgi:hypothetical protein
LIAGAALAGGGVLHYVLREPRVEVSGFARGGGGGLSIATTF